MILDTTVKKIQVVLAAAVAANQLPVVASWVDMTITTTTPGSTTTVTNSTTPVDVVAAPAANTQRVLQSISIYNKDTAAVLVTVSLFDVSAKEAVKVLLTPGQSLVYTPGNGWRVVTANVVGAAYASFRANKGGTDQLGVVTAVTTKVTNTNELWDNGGYYDAANSKWTPPAGQVVITSAMVFTLNVVADSPIFSYFYKNGVAFTTLITYGIRTDSLQTLVATMIDQCNGTDFYEVYCNAGGAGNKTISGQPTNTWWAGSAL